MAKIDEQISYNWLFFLLAGAFGAVTFWAVYNEAITRREYKGYQETFFNIEADLAKKAWDDARTKLESTEKYKSIVGELKKIEDDLATPARRTAMDDAKKKAKELQYIFDDKTQDATFVKSRLDEEYYFYTVAKHDVTPETPKDSSAYKNLQEHEKTYDGLQKELEEKLKIAAAAQVKYDEAQRAADAFEARKNQLIKEREDLRRPVDELERKYLAAVDKKKGTLIGGPATEIVQQNLEDLGRVDRCESCHVGSSRGGFETVSPKYFRSHPYRRTLFSLHPPEKFGCTTCHDGQGRATTKFYAHAPTDDHHYFEKHFWEYPLLKGPMMESQCRSCHRQEVELRANLRCETDSECPKDLKCGPLSAPLNAAANLDKSIDAKIEDGKFCGTPNAGDPDKIDVGLVDLAPHLSRGRKIIEEVACYGCHPIDGYETKGKAGPDLRHAAAKLNPSWMVEWIVNPRSFRPNTRMPNFFPEKLHPEEYPDKAKPIYVDGDAEIRKVAETDADRRSRALDLLPVERFQPEQQAALMTSFLLANSKAYELPQMPAGDAERGEKLVDTLGCYGCHNRTAPDEKEPPLARNNRSSHYDHGPELGNIGSKTTPQWIYAWIKDPKSYAPETRMPSLRLTDQEAADIATFLGGSKYVDGKPKEYPATAAGVDANNPDKRFLGKKLVNYYGCYGCHYVGGFEQTAGIGADLSDFGLKEVSRLDYGDYIVKHTQQTWESWIENKLKHPRVYRYERVDTRMPQFDFKPDEIQDIMVVLKGMRGKTKDSDVRGHRLTGMAEAREKGREMARWYNCSGCHTLDGHTGDIRAMKIYQGQDETGADRSRLAPPVLLGEGGKTQPPWLFSFLKGPTTLRPSLTVRMPTFGFKDDEATTLVQMFSAFDGAEFPYRDYSNIRLDDKRRVTAKSAFEAAQCLRCHSLSDKLTPDQAAIGAPNLLLTKSRLRGEWLLRWLKDPQVLAPGVNMPSFFTSGNPLSTADKAPNTANLPGIADIAKMDGDGVVTLLRDFLMNLDAPASAPTAQR